MRKITAGACRADEAEALLGKRRDNEHEVSIQIKTEFMQLWDGLTTDSHAGVLVLAATNRPGELDEAVLRRFTHQYEVRTAEGFHRMQVFLLVSNLLYDHHEHCRNERRGIDRLGRKRQPKPQSGQKLG